MKRKFNFPLEEALKNKQKKIFRDLKYYWNNILSEDLKNYIIQFINNEIINSCRFCNEIKYTRLYRDITVPKALDICYYNYFLENNRLYKIFNNKDLILDDEIYFYSCNKCILENLDYIFIKKSDIYTMKHIRNKRELFNKYFKLYDVKYIYLDKTYSKYNNDLMELLLLKDEDKDKINFQYYKVNILFEKSIVIDLLTYK